MSRSSKFPQTFAGSILLPVAIVAAILGLASSAAADECTEAVVCNPISYGTMQIGINCFKSETMTTRMAGDACVTTGSNNAQCNANLFSATFMSSYFYGAVVGAQNLFTTGTAAPYCQWSCPCGTVRIDGSDGLPVELLEFSVASDENAAGRPE